MKRALGAAPRRRNREADRLNGIIAQTWGALVRLTIDLGVDLARRCACSRLATRFTPAPGAATIFACDSCAPHAQEHPLAPLLRERQRQVDDTAAFLERLRRERAEREAAAESGLVSP